MITVVELEMAKVEATEYINGLLEAYVARTLDVEIPPSWDFGPVWPPILSKHQEDLDS